MPEPDAWPAFLACPSCHGSLRLGTDAGTCRSCGIQYSRNEHGYLQFIVRAGGALERSARLDSYAGHQQESAERFEREFLRPYLEKESDARVLDAGCGAGAAVSLLREHGFDAYGVDLPKTAVYWARRAADPHGLFCADVTALPFSDGTFDSVVSLGVVEHVGTLVGHCTLAPDFREQRRLYAQELVRVTKPGGRILITCPNKSFPVDVHHGPRDEAGPPSRVRSAVHGMSGLNFHRTWGAYHLLSPAEIRRMFCEEAGARELRALPPAGYFAYESLGNGVLRGMVRGYVERLPTSLRSGPLNPFILAEVRR